MKIKYISAVSLGVFMWMSFIPLSEATTPAWSYHIGEVTASAMSKNGNYTIVGTQQRYFYIFDSVGKTIRSDNAGGEITAVDISEDGTFFIGTKMGYYFSKIAGNPQKDVSRDVSFLSVSISDNGDFAIAGTEMQIYEFIYFKLVKEMRMCDSRETCMQKDQVRYTDVSSSGDFAVAATLDTIFLYDGIIDGWRLREIDGKISSLVISHDGQIIVCGTEEGRIFVFDSQLNEIVIYEAEDNITDLEITEDGTSIIYGTDNGSIALIGINGRCSWTSNPMSFVTSLSMSDNGNLIAAVGENLCLLDGSGRILQKITFSEPPQNVFLSHNGQYLFCASANNVMFFELYDNTLNFTNEYKYPSEKAIPLHDALVKKESKLDTTVHSLQSMQIADVNGDGKNELVIASGNDIIVAGVSGEKLLEIEFSAEPTLLGLLDVTGDLIPEIIVGHTDGRMTLEFYDGNGTLLANHEFYTRWRSQPENAVVISPLMAADIDKDKNIEVICLVSAGYLLEPRGIYVFEYPTFAEEWYYAYAPIPQPQVIVDLDKDGDLEILLGSNAPCNGRTVGDTDDCHAYVAAIDSQGKELWIKEVGAGYKRVWIDVADVDGNGTNEIVCGGWSFADDWGQLFILDKDGEYLRGEDNVFEHSLFLRGIADFDGDEKMEILTFSSEGYVMIFDYLLNLKQKKKIEINMGKFTRAIINDIDADGDKEIIVYSNDKRVYILSNELEVEWTESLPESVDLIHVFITNLYGCKNDLIISSDKINIYSCQYDAYTELPCPLWEITERTLLEESNTNLEKAKSAFEAGKYITSRFYYTNALDIYKNLEDEKMIAELSETIFKLDVRIGMILLAFCDVGLCVFLLYSWFIKKWSRLAEGVLLLSLPVLLGLFEVYSAQKEYLQIFVTYTVPSFFGSVTIILRQNILGFARSIAAIFSGHKDMLVLSIAKADGSYKVAVESIEERFNPVKESRKVVFSKEAKENLIKNIEYMLEVLKLISSENHTPSSTVRILRETGAIIYENFIPADFSDILKAKFLLLEVEDTEIPWELMYADNFFALKYAISRRIVTTDKVEIRHFPRKHGKKALIISDPRENLLKAKKECEIVYKRLKQKMEVVLIEGCDANLQRVANQFGQGFDIIHFAGHVNGGLSLADGVMTPEEVKEFIVGRPVVFVNGCKSEELARAFLLGGAVAYVGTIHPIHDTSAAEIAADFYDFCLQYQIGEALRRAREYHITKDLVWASLVMYGDPTLKLL